MSRPVRIYLVLLAALAVGWLLVRVDALGGAAARLDTTALAALVALYGASHLVRMLRLALLSLNERDKAFALASAHALTAFPSSFLPFKGGELLRLAALAYVHHDKRRALALWITERFGDIAVICAIILGLYLFEVDVPAAMQTVFTVFLLVGLGGLGALFAIAKTFVYLNRHLVLVSHSWHGLQLLRVSHELRQLELGIARCLEGRLTAFMLLSILIWVLEAGALSLFIQRHDSYGNFVMMFASSLLASLPGQEAGGFEIYKSLTLVLLTLLFLGAVMLAMRLKQSKRTRP